MNNRLMRLLRDNAKAKARAPLNVVLPKAGDTSAEATIYLYDVIVADEWEAEYWGGVAPVGFMKALEEASLVADTIHIRINCPGGDVFAARVMESAVRRCPKNVVAHIDGYAASAASYLALACDSVDIAQGGFFMIHKAWTMGWGNSDDFTATATMLSKIDASLVDTYVAETGQSAETIQAMMAAETWISSKEAIELGFADTIMEDAPKAAANWNLTAYANAPAPKAELVGEEKPAPEAEVEPTGETPTEATVEADIPQGEDANCTSEAEADSTSTQAFNQAYFDQRDRRIALCERLGR